MPAKYACRRSHAATFAALDKARRVLHSQNEGWPGEARSELTRAYGCFTFSAGPVNQTTLSETRCGGVIRRMSNLAICREDPEAILVCCLEEYDPAPSDHDKARV